MKYIVYDLKVTADKPPQSTAGQQIAELGAIELREREGGRLHMARLYHAHMLLAGATRPAQPSAGLAGAASRKLLELAPPFPEVIGQFRQWVEEGDRGDGAEGTDGTCLISLSWGSNNPQLMLKLCRKHRVDPAFLGEGHDLKLSSAKLHGNGGRINSKPWELQRAMSEFKLPYYGRPGQAVDNAFNTAKLFARIYESGLLPHANNRLIPREGNQAAAAPSPIITAEAPRREPRPYAPLPRHPYRGSSACERPYLPIRSVRTVSFN